MARPPVLTGVYPAGRSSRGANDLRWKAAAVYTQIAVLPALERMRRRGPTFVVASVVGLLARLITRDRIGLDEQLDRASIRLGCPEPVLIPLPIATAFERSACAGASNLLLQLASLALLDSPLGPLPTDEEAVAAEVTSQWERDGVPDWLMSVPTAELVQAGRYGPQRNRRGLSRD